VHFGAPTEPLAISALVVGALLFVAPPRWISAGGPRGFRAAASLLAALASAAYVHLYLRGGPRIVDATTYWLEGRALAEGHLAFDLGDWPTATSGRFLVRDVLAGGRHAAGIFPPGYPAVLALGFLVGAPLAVGPLLAAAITRTTTGLAEDVAARLDLDDADRALVPRIAAVLTVVCATLRYHTADTMSHGLAAWLLVVALRAAWRVRDSGRASWIGAAVVGLSLGWLFATRPVSGVAGAALTGWMLGRGALDRRLLLGGLAGATTPIVLFVLHQRAATGAFFTSSQSLYYALADGPAGCFAYGFGPSVGCRNEHGDFVAHNLPRGYDLFAAVKTSLRRLEMHLGDPLDGAPLAPVAALALAWASTRRATRPLAASLPMFVLAYAPFYFDGNYPGGGARFYADQLPLELVCVALAVPRFSALLRDRGLAATSARWGARLLGSTLVCSAFFAAAEHGLLRDREGGRPMFEPRVVAEHHVARGLVFVDTDHGFSLGFDPDARPDRAVVVARRRDDASDRLLWESLGRPPAYRYDYAFDPAATERSTLSPFEPRDTSTLEAESLWPPVGQRGGYARIGFDRAASNGRVLSFVPDGSGDGVTLSLPRPLAGARVEVFALVPCGASAHVTVRADGREIGASSLTSGAPACPARVGGPPVDLPRDARTLELVFRGDAGIGLDALEIAGLERR
jgi:hypothetical protein